MLTSKKHYAEAGFILKDAMITGISPQNENRSNIFENVEENTNSHHANSNIENMTLESSDIESTSKSSKKITNKKRKKSKRKKQFLVIMLS